LEKRCEELAMNHEREKPESLHDARRGAAFHIAPPDPELLLSQCDCNTRPTEEEIALDKVRPVEGEI
jgi:hypothetical protein